MREPPEALEFNRQFWNERYQSFSLSESGWMGAGDLYNAYLYQCKRQALMRALERIGIAAADSTLTVLDAGCGQGFFAEVWANAFPNVSYTGVDLCAKVVAHLQQKFREQEFYCGDFAAWRDPRGRKFDLIQSFEVLHLLLSDVVVEQAVCNLAAQVKPGGHILLTAALPEQAAEPNAYIRHQSRTFWESTFRKAGLELRVVNRMYYWLPDGGPKNRYANRLLRLPGPWLLYGLDRLAHRLKLPQLFGSWDSRMKLLVLWKE